MAMNEELNQQVERALAAVRAGGVILYPTDTVWGLGCDATNPQAVARIFEIKQRSDQKAMIVLVDKVEGVSKYVRSVPEVGWQLLESAEGASPLTVIFEGGVGVASNLLPPEGTIAIRVPDHDFCKALIRRMGRPLVSTSANISGMPSPAGFDDISQTIVQAVDYVVDSSVQGTPTARPSSIVALGASGQIKIIR